METSKDSGTAKTTDNNPATNPLGGFDISKLLQNDGVMEVLKHLLSSGGAVAANYFIWIKPLQDKVEAMNKKVEENERQLKKQEERIGELEDGQEQLLQQLNRKEKEKEEMELHGGNGEYFSIRKNKRVPDLKHRKYAE